MSSVTVAAAITSEPVKSKFTDVLEPVGTSKPLRLLEVVEVKELSKSTTLPLALLLPLIWILRSVAAIVIFEGNPTALNVPTVVCNP